MGVGVLTDFGPLIANPKSLLLGAAAQFGIFAAFLGALCLGFNFQEAASIGIIGGADGPTAIFTTTQLAPHLYLSNCCGIFLYGFDSDYSATYYEVTHYKERKSY